MPRQPSLRHTDLLLATVRFVAVVSLGVCAWESLLGKVLESLGKEGTAPAPTWLRGERPRSLAEAMGLQWGMDVERAAPCLPARIFGKIKMGSV